MHPLHELIISQLPPTPLFTSDPVFAYKNFETHASLTGNATSQSYLAFFHATGYQNVVQVDQAKAQLYYTFAAHGGDKAAQMALGYRYWTGIGVAEDCECAVEWYNAAAEQGKLGMTSPCILLTCQQRSNDSYLVHLAVAPFH
jgi:TPR repeat protein